MTRYMSTSAQRAAEIAALPFSALSDSEKEELHRMAQSRELIHVDDRLARQELFDTMLEDLQRPAPSAPEARA